MDDSQALGAELAGSEQLAGFALRSTLTATVKKAGKKKAIEVFRLQRQIKTLNHTPLPDSLFRVSKSLNRLKAK